MRHYRTSSPQLVFEVRAGVSFLEHDISKSLWLVVVTDHGPKLRVILADSFKLPHLRITDLHDLQRFHVEVVLQREVDVHLTRTYQQLL